ncbi:MAG: hypothetical protein KAS93_06915 [Gammaproteobacteria bacterium]|nr:hypothetical protein [Gammaproteobacteria bacterium]
MPLPFFCLPCKKNRSPETDQASSRTPLLDISGQPRTVNYRTISDIESQELSTVHKQAEPPAYTDQADSSRILAIIIILIARLYGMGNCTLYAESTLLGVSGLIAAFWKTLGTIPTIILSICCELTIMFFLMPTIHGAYLPKLQKAMGQSKFKFTKRGALGGFCKGGPTGFSVYFMLRNFTPEIVKDSLAGVISFALISVVFVIVHTLCEGALFSEKEDQSFKEMLKFVLGIFSMPYDLVKYVSSTNSEAPPPLNSANDIVQDEGPPAYVP